MPTVQVPAQLTVEHLMAAIRQLSPDEWRDFKQQLDAWQAQNGWRAETDEELIRATEARLPAADERRLRKLIRKSEQGTLTPSELSEYGALAQQAERLDVTRVEALAELARRRGKPARAVMEEIGWKRGEDGA